MVTSRLGEERITFSAVIAFSCSAVIRIQKNVTVFCYIKKLNQIADTFSKNGDYFAERRTVYYNDPCGMNMSITLT